MKIIKKGEVLVMFVLVSAHNRDTWYQMRDKPCCICELYEHDPDSYGIEKWYYDRTEDGDTLTLKERVI